MDSKQKQDNNHVPKSIIAIALIIFLSMFVYAQYFDYSPAEKTLSEFYESYFNKDYETVANHLSVFWATRVLPQYSVLPPEELLASRDAIEKDVAELVQTIEQDVAIPGDIKLNILREYTKTGEYSALIVYELVDKENTPVKEVAVLIFEAGKFRIFDLSPIDDKGLNEIIALDLNVLDDNFHVLLNPTESK